MSRIRATRSDEAIHVTEVGHAAYVAVAGVRPHDPLNHSALHIAVRFNTDEAHRPQAVRCVPNECRYDVDAVLAAAVQCEMRLVVQNFGLVVRGAERRRRWMRVGGILK